MKEITIIGGGASGMIAAISAAKIAEGGRVQILEKNATFGRKLLATGNGRCNFSNNLCTYKDLSDFTRAAFQDFGVKETLAFFEELGIDWKEEEEGRLYPYSEQAGAIQEALIWQMEALGIHMVPSFPVVAISKGCMGFEIVGENGKKLRAEKVILATGGKAGSPYGSTGEGYGFAKVLGHTTVKPIPALVQLTCRDKDFQQLKGIRVKGQVALKYQEQVLSKENGEIQFTQDGLSGICIFNLSRYLRIENMDKGFQDYTLGLDLFPELERGELLEKLVRRREHLAHRDKVDFLAGSINKRLGPVLLKEAQVGIDGKGSGITDAQLDRLAALLKDWEIGILGAKGWKEAQVTSGGICTTEIDENKMASRLTPGLYFAGEVMDVDGRCGGYNLQWAWTSGYVAGKCAAMDSGA